MIVVILLASLSTLLVLSAVSGYFAFAYALMASLVLIALLVFSNPIFALQYLAVQNLAVLVVAYLRLTVLGFSGESILVLLIVQKIVMLEIFLQHTVSLSPVLIAVQFLVGLSVLFLTTGKLLILLNSSISILFLAGCSGNFDEVLRIFLVVYAIQSLVLFTEFSSSLPATLFISVIAFGVPVTVANVLKLVLTAMSDLLELSLVMLGYVVNLGLFLNLQRVNLVGLGSG